MPATPTPRVAALNQEAEALDAMGRAHRSWIYPLIGIAIFLLVKLALARVFGPPPEAWRWVLLGVVLLFLLGGLWRWFRACWDLWKYRRWGFLWPISIGLVVNIPGGFLVVSFVMLLTESGLWRRMMQSFQGG